MQQPTLNSLASCCLCHIVWILHWNLTWAASSTKMWVNKPVTRSWWSPSEVTKVVTMIWCRLMLSHVGDTKCRLSDVIRQYFWTVELTVRTLRSVSQTRSSLTSMQVSVITLSKWRRMYSSAALYITYRWTDICISKQLSRTVNIISHHVSDHTLIAEWDQLLPWWSHHQHWWTHHTRLTVMWSLAMTKPQN